MSSFRTKPQSDRHSPTHTAIFLVVGSYYRWILLVAQSLPARLGDELVTVAVTGMTFQQQTIGREVSASVLQLAIR